jgi:glucokinase
VDLKSRAISARENQDVVINEICDTISSVLTPATEGIGIGVPSIVDVEKGIIYDAPNIPSFREVPLKDILQRRFRIPVFVNNDANCFALGELHFGAARGYKHLIGLIVGTGMGSGVVINGKLYAGPNCGAGEIGHIPYKDQEIEYYCSGRYFLREFGLDGAALHERALKGDATAQSMLASFGDDFAHAIMTLLYAFDPEIIVMGGSVSNAYPFYEARMRQRLAAFKYQRSLARLVIAQSKEPHIAVLGAAALGLDAR